MLKNAKGKQVGIALFFAATWTSNTAAGTEDAKSYLDMELAELMSIEITSVSKKSQALKDTASAVFVISQEEIQMAGATSIPEVLRIVPGVHVAQIDSNKWAISSRGFNSRYSNKLLVMIDGRSVYTPSYSGVYWDAQDLVMQDIERIEVIRGPGASIWGANAVNGVINIITKHTRQTQGGYFSLLLGNEEKGTASLRYGAKISHALTGRVYAKYSDHDHSVVAGQETDAGDAWDSMRAGFRLDYESGTGDSFTLQGDIYDNDIQQTIGTLWLDPADPSSQFPYFIANYQDKASSSGHNIMAKWHKTLAEGNSINVQSYYDHVERNEVFLGQHNHTFDLEITQELQLSQDSALIWGGHYRRIEDDFDNTFSISILPKDKLTELYSLFGQYDTSLTQGLFLTLGAKVEHNCFTGTEWQPNLRLLWKLDDTQTWWTAVSRAVRIPSRVEYGALIASAVIPGQQPFTLATRGSREFKSEKLTAFELGYRVQATDAVHLDIALFYNKYQDQGSFEPTSYIDLGTGLIPAGFKFDNKLEADSRGAEVAFKWWVNERWHIYSSYSFIELDVDRKEGGADMFIGPVIENGAPNQMFSLQSKLYLSETWQAYFSTYYVDQLPRTSFSASSASVPDYFSINAGVTWQPLEKAELSVYARNLFDKQHPEFIAENFSIATDVERSIFVKLSMAF